MKSWWVAGIVLVCAFSAAAANAQAYGVPPGYHPYERQSIRFRGGMFTPDGNSGFWDQNENDFTADANDFQDWTWGMDYTIDLAPNFALSFSGDWYETTQQQSYKDFEDDRGHRISHDTSLYIAPFRAGLMVKLVPPTAPVVPYLGAGGGVYFWDYHEDGDFIDFDSPRLDVFHDHLHDSGTAFGYYLVGGLEIPVGSSFSVLAEGRWDHVSDSFSEDFSGFDDIDLGGLSIQGGIAWRF